MAKPNIKPHWVCGNTPSVVHGNTPKLGVTPTKKIYGLLCNACENQAYIASTDRGVAIEFWNRTFGCNASQIIKQ